MDDIVPTTREGIGDQIKAHHDDDGGGDGDDEVDANTKSMRPDY
jgi:hypothetical protein